MISHFLQKAAKDLTGAPRSSQPISAADDRMRLEAAIGWLGATIEACKRQGSSKGFRLGRGWMPPYPETTGYIIPTLYVAADELDRPQLAQTAEALARWLLTQQQANGGFIGLGVGIGTEPVVFDTGMILMGLNVAWMKTGDEVFRRAGEAAARFLSESLDPEGCFVHHCDYGMPHAYNVRAAWALGAYGRLSGAAWAVQGALANAAWTIAHQRPNGFYEQNAFKPGGNANTHGIAYVMQGLLQLGILFDRDDLIASVACAADAVTAAFDRQGCLPAEVGPDWQPLSSHLCLTGYAQLAIVLMRLGAFQGRNDYTAAAHRFLDAVLEHQDIVTSDANVRGAIAGSYPVWGRYAPMQYPNWATKFLADALIERLTAGKHWSLLDLGA